MPNNIQGIPRHMSQPHIPAFIGSLGSINSHTTSDLSASHTAQAEFLTGPISWKHLGATARSDRARASLGKPRNACQEGHVVLFYSETPLCYSFAHDCPISLQGGCY